MKSTTLLAISNKKNIKKVTRMQLQNYSPIKGLESCYCISYA